MLRIIIFACIIVFLFLVLSFGCLYVNLTLVGKIMPVDRITVFKTELIEEGVRIELNFLMDSSLVYRKCRYRVVDDVLYVKIYSALHSPFFQRADVSVLIKGDFSTIQRVVLEDNNQSRTIWGRK